MKTNKMLINGIWIGIFSLMVIAGSAMPTQAHEAKCPHCELDLTQNTLEQDNEVALKFGKKRIEYKCVMCAIADADKSYTGDLTILAPSEIKGKPIEITRKNGQWSAPEGTVFIGNKVKHRYCDRGYRAFTTKAAFDAHVQKNKALLRDAKPITMDEVVQISKSDIMEKKK